MCRFQAKMFLNLKIFFQILRKVILLNTWTRCKTTIEVTQLESLAAVYEPHQLISQPTHLLLQTSSCIDLLFTDQPNLLIVVSILHYIQTAIMRLHIVNLITILSTHLL